MEMNTCGEKMLMLLMKRVKECVQFNTYLLIFCVGMPSNRYIVTRKSIEVFVDCP